MKRVTFKTLLLMGGVSLGTFFWAGFQAEALTTHEMEQVIEILRKRLRPDAVPHRVIREYLDMLRRDVPSAVTQIHQLEEIVRQRQAAEAEAAAGGGGSQDLAEEEQLEMVKAESLVEADEAKAIAEAVSEAEAKAAAEAEAAAEVGGGGGGGSATAVTSSGRPNFLAGLTNRQLKPAKERESVSTNKEKPKLLLIDELKDKVKNPQLKSVKERKLGSISEAERPSSMTEEMFSRMNRRRGNIQPGEVASGQGERAADDSGSESDWEDS